jgi:hypothetical protein
MGWSLQEFSRRNLAALVCLAAACPSVVSCSDEADPESDSEEEASPSRGSVPIAGTGGSLPRPRLKVPVAIDGAADSGLHLTSATAYTITLAGCASGYTATVTEANADGLEVYEHDRNCLAKLTQFTWNGTVYYPTAGDPFTSWQVGDIARFDETGEPGTAPLYVGVSATLQTPVTSSDQIRYSVLDNDSGATRKLLAGTIGTSGNIPVDPQPAPSFNIESIELVGLDAATEAAKLVIILECTASIGISNTCASVDLATIDYKLVSDTYGGSLNQSQADAIFATAGTSVSLPGDRIAPGDFGTANGGFRTATLTGPANLASNPNTLLVLRSSATSYQYFNIDFAVAPSY